jgi:leader peptidase (prepilin peptidase)/N-methyltransferase|tara:strand:- start:477 stop:1244 length:768 start_codon:yes stop_codon:yes gene_type:complete
MMIFILFLFGAVMGSFLNVCIYRIPREMSVVKPGSRCPACQKPVRTVHNLPIVGYLMLRGKCAACGAAISLRYLVVELLTGLLTAATFLKFGTTLEGAIWLALVFLLIVISFIDAEHLFIPDSLLIGCAVVWIVSIISIWSPETLKVALLGAAAFGGFLLTAKVLGRLLFRKEALGLGDVKLGVVLGAFLGWELTVVSLYAAFLLAALVGGAGLISKKVRFGQMLPFGPFLALGGIIAIFWGDWVIAQFVRWMLS